LEINQGYIRIVCLLVINNTLVFIGVMRQWRARSCNPSV